MSPLVFRRRIRFGPLVLHFGRRGPSTSVKVGPVTHNLRSGRTSLNLPGPWSWVFGRRRRRR